MRPRPVFLVTLTLLLAATACSSSAEWTPLPSGAEPPATCARADAEDVIEISADQLRFSVPCMVAPAGQDFTVRFTNHESQPHNVSIYGDSAKGTKHLEGETITGPDRTIEYPVGALDAGDYYFDCIVHPADMNGGLYVR
jgi:plastocyanin